MVGVRVRGESSASVRRICTSRYDDIFMCDIRLTGKVRGWSEACWSMVGWGGGMVVYEPWIRRVAWVCIFGGGVRLDSGLLRDINCMLVETWISNAEVSGVLRAC
jgi:hypothetical protein